MVKKWVSNVELNFKKHDFKEVKDECSDAKLDACAVLFTGLEQAIADAIEEFEKETGISVGFSTDKVRFTFTSEDKTPVGFVGNRKDEIFINVSVFNDWDEVKQGVKQFLYSNLKKK